MKPLALTTALLALALIGSSPARADSGPTAAEGEREKFEELFQHWLDKEPAPRRSTSARRSITPLPGQTGDGGRASGVTSGMGMRVNPILGRQMFHAGVDLAAPAGKAVRATADGVVTRAGWSGGYGLLVVVRHANGYETRYAHMSRIRVAPGQSLAKGQVIGHVGSTGRSTGPHLHYEVRREGEPVDPKAYMGR
ncbi:M23 family metallopeptidase [Tsuneonella sp. CC-YZS046]|uniref:M23 family metallopeptidase n=1 Tax=Tsuneonella sp. CC-YZS046 TaxID=3042152 RepID=UPI002D79BC0B|nr:M23 family metallopeptidase [Tsuneonella sp. CC-YZS046]WRO65595.1 M23 family metallopeptidase [Tsuneonella sp. CC-YZS046]